MSKTSGYMKRYRQAKKSGNSGKIKPTALQIFKENASQLNDAIREGQKRKVATIEFEDATGKTVRRYFNGASYSDRKSSMAEKYSSVKGTYKAKFKKPNNWK